MVTCPNEAVKNIHRKQIQVVVKMVRVVKMEERFRMVREGDSGGER